MAVDEQETSAETNGPEDGSESGERESVVSVLTGRHKQWRVNLFAITWMSYAGYYFCRKHFSIVKKPLVELMGIDSAQIAQIGTAFLVAYMLGQFITAALARRIACRTLLLAGLGVSALATVGLGLMTSQLTAAYVPSAGAVTSQMLAVSGTMASTSGISMLGVAPIAVLQALPTEAGLAAVNAGSVPNLYWPIFILMFINGIAQGTGWGANIGILAHWFRRKERGTVMAFWATCYMLGSVLAKGFAAYMQGEHGVPWAFFGASIVVGGIWTLVFLFVKDRPESYGMRPIVHEHYAVEAADHKSVKLGWTADVRRTIIMMGVAYFCFKFVRYALDSWTPMLIEENFGGSTERAGYSSAVFDLLGFFGVIFGGAVTDRFFKGSRTLVTFGMTVGMLAGVVFLWQLGASSSGMFVIGLGIIGFMLAGPDSLLSGVGTVDVASKRGAVVAAAIVNGIGSLGSVVQEMAIGYLKIAADTTAESMNNVLILLVSVSIGGVLTTSVLLRWRRKGTSNL